MYLLIPILFILTATPQVEPPPEKVQNIVHAISKGIVYFSVGTALESTSSLAKLGWGICHLTPWSATTGKECRLLSRLAHSAAQRAFTQMYRGSHFLPPSQSSWHLNRERLSQIPADSNQEKQLLHFLEKRWLAKSTGHFSSLIDWVFPCFEISYQIHPEATSSYARSPALSLSQTYINRMEDWKQSLPHPHNFPLILTRPFDVRNYLPDYIAVQADEKIQTTIEKINSKTQIADSKVIVDLTNIFPQEEGKWLQAWNAYRAQFSKLCKNPSQILCIERVQQETIGGLRILPLTNMSDEELDLHQRYLLNWISIFGLSANRVELDRWQIEPQLHSHGRKEKSPLIESKKDFIAYLNSFEQNWTSNHPQKTLMLKGAIHVLKGLLTEVDLGIHSPNRSEIVQISLSRIKQQLELLKRDHDLLPFFEMISHIEQIHSDISSLLEIFTPFTPFDFPFIFRELLTSFPENLEPLTSYGIHSSGMTSLAGILKAVETTRGSKPRVLYGENSYYECINALKLVSNASSTQDATDEDWKEVDLILAQFNPALKRVDLPGTEYKVEKIGEFLRKSLHNRQGKPLTLAIDGTLDFIHSPRVGALLDEFQEEIKLGNLTIICYRSGLKFDLFGMDNYAGSPFFMVHNQDAKWSAFDSLLTDPLLQTDHLSLNWFCLAYKTAAPDLKLYQKQIFDNTRALLNQIPPRLLTEQTYRIIPFDQEIDPSFLDIKIFGPMHQIRAHALVGGCLSVRSMEKKKPILYRPGLGFYHSNYTVITSPESTTYRLTVGLDPTEIDLLADCFKAIDSLNGN